MQKIFRYLLLMLLLRSSLPAIFIPAISVIRSLITHLRLSVNKSSFQVSGRGGRFLMHSTQLPYCMWQLEAVHRDLRHCIARTET